MEEEYDDTEQHICWTECPFCCGVNDVHAIRCPNNIDPFDNLISEGYD